MSRSDLAGSVCSVSRTVERIGDPWTLMILREVFLGTRRFDTFQKMTGASPHVLSQRLKQLTGDGILERRIYSEHPQRFEYRLTGKGRDLWPIIMALKGWGDKWLDHPDTVRLTHKGCGAHMTPVMSCPQCGEPVSARDVTAEIGPDLEQERQANLRSSSG